MQSESKELRNQIIRYVIYLVIVLGLTALSFYLTIGNNAGKITDTLKNANIGWVVAILGVVICCFLLRSIVVFALTRTYVKKYMFHRAFAIDQIGTLYRLVTPAGVGSHFMELYTYKKQGIPISSAVSALAMNSIIHQILLILFGAVSFIVKYDFIDIDKIEIEFTKAKPLNRIHLMKVEFGEATDYTITYEDLFSPPTGKRLEKVKEMRVTRTIYAPGTERKDLTQEEIDTPLVPTEYEFSFSNAVHDLSVVCLIDTEEIDVGAEIVEQKTYWCKVRINNPPQVPIKVNLTIRGYEFGISTAVEAITLNNKGKIQSWDNPLISSVQDAQNLVTWVGEYYAAGNEYDLSFRGDPALEANDLTYLESQYVESLMIRLEEIETNYNGSISGKITARRKL